MCCCWQGPWQNGFHPLKRRPTWNNHHQFKCMLYFEYFQPFGIIFPYSYAYMRLCLALYNATRSHFQQWKWQQIQETEIEIWNDCNNGSNEKPVTAETSRNSYEPDYFCGNWRKPEIGAFLYRLFAKLFHLFVGIYCFITWLLSRNSALIWLI